MLYTPFGYIRAMPRNKNSAKSAFGVLNASLAIAGLFITTNLNAQETTEATTSSTTGEEEVFQLGELDVYGKKLDPVELQTSVINKTKIDALEVHNIGRALRKLPGVTMMRFGARNEEAIYVRGFGRRQVPIYVDGVPVSVPYDGFADLGRFTTMGIASIDLNKGYSSVLSGPNAIGGVINIVSTQPTEPLELNVKAGIFTGEGRVANVKYGSLIGKWYTQAGISYREMDYFELPDSFEATSTEDGGKRDNSYEKDWKVSAKVGFKPNNEDEYVVGFLHQEGEKGTPVYTGTDETTSLKYWQWPEWDKSTVYYTSMTHYAAFYLHPRFYYDRYDNTLEAYDDATYSTMKKKSSFISIYDDYCYGGSVEVGSESFENFVVKSALHIKTDHHDEHDAGEEHYVFEDRVGSLGVEATTTYKSPWSLQGGFSYDWMSTEKAVDTNTGLPFEGTDFDSINPAASLQYSLGDVGTMHLSVAHKSRFPTIKDRYSYKMGKALPNPDLEPESAMHYEIGYVGNPIEDLWISVSAFYSKTSDTIESVAKIAYDEDGYAVSQNRNVGESECKGVEIAWQYYMLSNLSFGMNYTYLDQKNVSSPELYSTYVPEHAANVFASYSPLKWWHITACVELSSDRYTDTSGAKVGGFTVYNLKSSFDIGKHYALEVGAKNLTDHLYAYQEGYPEAGRTLFFSFRYQY